MDWFSKAFIKSSLTWLGAGVTLGVGIAARPAWIVYKPVHTHMNLLGFVSMLVFGVAYHVMPRFIGHTLFSPRLAGWHWWLANSGLLLMAAGMALSTRLIPGSGGVLLLGGLLSALGAYTFIYNIWRTLDGSAAARQAAGGSATIPLGRRPASRR